MTTDELITALRSGKTLEEIADEAGVDLQNVQDAIQAAHEEELRTRIEQAVADGTLPPPPAPEDRRVTRAGMVWAAVATALAVMVLLIVFILQNQDYVQVRYFGLEGAVPLGIALFIAAVGGGILVAVAGAARIIQLRAAAHRRKVLAQRVR